MIDDAMAADAADLQTLPAQDLAIWRSPLDTTGELRRVLGTQLQASGLSPGDDQVLLTLRDADGTRWQSSVLQSLQHHLYGEGSVDRIGGTQR